MARSNSVDLSESITTCCWVRKNQPVTNLHIRQSKDVQFQSGLLLSGSDGNTQKQLLWSVVNVVECSQFSYIKQCPTVTILPKSWVLSY